MTGGLNGERLSSVEVYHPGTNTSCTLPSLPEKIYQHSQDGLVLCGGYTGFTSLCLYLDTNDAQWNWAYNISEERALHSSWRRQDGTILLMGGTSRWGKTTTELISESSGVSTPGFILKYETM